SSENTAGAAPFARRSTRKDCSSCLLRFRSLNQSDAPIATKSMGLEPRWILRRSIGNGGLKADEVAELLHMNARTLARQLFKLETSISKELSSAKVAYAKDALSGTDRSIEDIAAALGYSDPSNFARAFAKEENMSPAQFRKVHR
ncbi:helix-turn-helix transcriptional regulator, partial [Sedimentitalea sp.]|uniref:helix-turn-helix domain-containing protein n=1 Tax=Sedimentitalea sp. TaxID=2048915 RepID=UPI003297A521